MDEDLDQFLEDHGVVCLAGGPPFLGIFDMPGEVLSLGRDGAVSIEYTITALSSEVVAQKIKYGTPVTVKGLSYMARQPLPLDDGAFTAIPLSKV